MSLAAGQTLSFYEVLGPLGAGGMGEVWRARDTRLEREVAIKVLPDELAADEERLRRFEREAKTLASLNHANLAHVYGIDQVGDTCFIAMELVPGEDLAAQLSRGPLPVDEALDVGRQIAEGLEAAHEAGVVHRDLKPANMRVTPEGLVKILDFGLAKPLHVKAGEGTSTAEPDSFLLTEEGLVLGTPTYMSPEQARGRAVDRRTDVWAFGCVLFECLTGRRAFGGESLTDILAAIVEREPDWTALPEGTPPAVRRLLRRCLAKNPADRLRDVGDARLEIRDAREEEAPSVKAVRETPRRHSRTAGLRLAVVLVLVVASGALGWWAGGRREPPGSPALRAFRIETASNLMRPVDGLSGPVLSPDGRRIAFVDQDRLFVRDLGRLEPRELPGIEDAERPFWSPAGDWIGFFRGALNHAAELWKVPAEGGPATFLGRLPHSAVYGATWSPEGYIVVASTDVRRISETRLYSIDPGGGEFSELAHPGFPDIGAGTLFPHFLPDGRTLLAVEVGEDEGWSIVALRDDRRTELVQHPGELLADPVFSSTGHVVYQRRRGFEARGQMASLRWEESEGIWAFPFDPSSLRRKGDPFRVSSDGLHPSVARDGTLIYQEIEGEELQQLAWVDRSGTLLESVGEPHEEIFAPELSPDGRRVAYGALDRGNDDVWILDLEGGSRTRLTVSPLGDRDPAWSRDGLRIAFSSDRGGSPSIYSLSASGRGSVQPLAVSREPQFYPEWEPDEAGVLFHVFVGSGWNIGRQSVQGELEVLFPDPGAAPTSHPQISPDGGFLARQGSGGLVLVSPRSDLGQVWQISTQVGGGARWSSAGDAILYVDRKRNTLMEVPVKLGADVEIGRERALFSGSGLPAALISYGGRPQYDVTDDGRKFLVVLSLREKHTVAIWVESWHLEGRE